ncbi:ribosome silencing factor [Ahrensia marina]|uniref:ribosome silencing factor n=1 Tax=Ahrensia marina TaxID=1514904 RepID=UPI0035D0A98C
MTPQNTAVDPQATASLATRANASGASILSTVQSVLEDSKAEDIITIDLDGKSALADTMIIASGRSHRHVSAVADHVQRALKEAGHGSPRVEGLPHADWVLIDTGDVILHLFRPEVRSFYNMEKLWDDSFAETLGSDTPNA